MRALPLRRFGGSGVNLRLATLIVALVVVTDRATKWVVTTTMQRGDSIPVVPGFFSVTYVRNPGAAFGMLADSPLRVPVLVLFALAAIGGLTYLLVQTPRTQVWERTAAAIIIGGALGNLYDRFRYGWVIDFLDIYVQRWHWPAFNVADSCITVGVVVLLIASMLRREGDEPPSSRQEDFDGQRKAA